MTISRFAVVALLVASALNLSLMVPGGFVETRDFSAYPAIVLGAFNVFLTVLGLGSLVLAFVLARNGKGYGLSALAGLAFVCVYLLDLIRVFPVTPNPMSLLLATLEWLGTGLGGALVVVAITLARHEATNSETLDGLSFPAPVIVGLVLVTLIIVAYATRSAMGI
ncbi:MULTISPECIES: hypothetical protein [Alphaproteobacteria]|uniref:DUF8051 domain-containing protein n=2 Tax=Alphaproteobacteria TaxID=28211 RepID=A0A512HIY4_9HYPH|nr:MULTISPECIES: hypothetical protein [Alphaproteobacteria]GEO85405.1 hypothetical protein RNA01_23370 [Ciceribacter naphthalenivorans]GLR21044.1 hypothetical protein GCM10007920_08290 [Ciceribacter naphthalenivorans]GLT03900.1 hypothetical protein GCM10007926_08290 [Sphingomonas psychrolutea]